MRERRRNHVKALYTFDAVVHRVQPDQWDHPTPCSEWTARQIVSHLCFILPLWIGRDAPEGTELTLADGDPVATWDRSLDLHLAAIDDEADLSAEVSTNMGPMPMGQSLGILLIDPLLHAWDLGRAVDVDPHLPRDLARVALDTLTFARDFIDTMFCPALGGPDDDVVDAMLRVSGRDPAWQADAAPRDT